MIVTGTFATFDERTKQTVTADEPTYEEALAKIQEQTPEGFRMISILVER